MDVNECEDTNGGCSELRECENTLGSFACGSCFLEGYVESGLTDCVVADPCAADMHHCAQKEYCINHAVGEFHCEVGTHTNNTVIWSMHNACIFCMH